MEISIHNIEEHKASLKMTSDKVALIMYYTGYTMLLLAIRPPLTLLMKLTDLPQQNGNKFFSVSIQQAAPFTSTNPSFSKLLKNFS